MSSGSPTSPTRAAGKRASRPGADVELVHHSDRGSQYSSIDFTQELTDHGVLEPVRSVGVAYDNAVPSRSSTLPVEKPFCESPAG
jgi:transposase InsO family protein